MSIGVMVFQVKYFLMFETVDIINLIITYEFLNIQTLLCDVEDSREKLDRFFSYNFLFFDDD